MLGSGRNTNDLTGAWGTPTLPPGRGLRRWEGRAQCELCGPPSPCPLLSPEPRVSSSVSVSPAEHQFKGTDTFALSREHGLGRPGPSAGRCE